MVPANSAVAPLATPTLLSWDRATPTLLSWSHAHPVALEPHPVPTLLSSRSSHAHPAELEPDREHD